MALVSRMRAPSSRALATPTRLSTAHPRRPAAAAVAAARNISAASAKAPGLADITPDGGAAFSGRQREFRRDLAAAQRQSEQQESQCKSADRATRPLTSRPSPDAPVADGPGAASASASTLSSERSSLFAKTLGSLGSAGTEDARAHDSAAEQRDAPGRRKGGPLASLIYGTHEGRNLDRELERSFSQVLARGKYVHSIVFHEVKPDRVDEYVELVAGWYPRLAQMPEHKVNLVGSWRSEVGECDTFVHIWEYQGYHGYHSSLHAIKQHRDFPAFDAKLRTLIQSKRSSLMQEFSFWPTTPPRQLGGLFELRSYTLHPGNLLEWETHWRRGLKARREVMEGVGAWFVQVGELNTVHHLWQFANLEERKVRREKSWSVEGWGETVHKTVPLIQAMRSTILIPMPWSPVG